MKITLMTQLIIFRMNKKSLLKKKQLKNQAENTHTRNLNTLDLLSALIIIDTLQPCFNPFIILYVEKPSNVHIGEICCYIIRLINNVAQTTTVIEINYESFIFLCSRYCP